MCIHTITKGNGWVSVYERSPAKIQSQGKEVISQLRNYEEKSNLQKLVLSCGRLAKHVENVFPGLIKPKLSFLALAQSATFGLPTMKHDDGSIISWKKTFSNVQDTYILCKVLSCRQQNIVIACLKKNTFWQYWLYIYTPHISNNWMCSLQFSKELHQVISNTDCIASQVLFLNHIKNSKANCTGHWVSTKLH